MQQQNCAEVLVWQKNQKRAIFVVDLHDRKKYGQGSGE